MYPTTLTAALAAERQKTYRAEAAERRKAYRAPATPGRASGYLGAAARIRLAVRTHLTQAARSLARPAREAACGCEC